ncbi:hypothetical protein DP939_08320 [Spongiactinospora rosea]|uniref:Uncharacterized protein n=1 Tax=Spongiactinospora rosea TaxID=2248750 RepID=A0A366M478_9ACTN|nr:hypothetical protein [Spongiactinospora rosea]RBQ21048.1 hypothetical protein DP939_08320 [Spongiactinospora rosea]
MFLHVTDRPRPSGLLIGFGFAAAAVACLVAAALVPAGEPGARLVLVAVLVGGYAAAAADVPAALCTGLFAWLFVTGFLVNHAGHLVFSGVADLARLGVLVAAAAAGWVFGVLRAH